MDRGNKEKILEMIESIVKKNSEMKDFISNLSIPSRNDMLIEITHDIIKKNSILREFIGMDSQIKSKEEMERASSNIIIDDFLNKIQKNPSKKVIYLREFLDLFQDSISENDKDVILNSLKDEKNNEKLKERMISLIDIFKLNL
ncbi:MAG: hypothetical protein ACFE91_15660 [Promethearchaeota archaeon]